MPARIVCHFLAACLLSVLMSSSPARAQSGDPYVLGAPVGESGKAYESAKRFRGIQSDLIYLRPDAKPGDYWDKSVQTERDYTTDRPNDWPLTRTLMIIVSAAALIAICLFAVRFAPSAAFNTTSPSDERRRGAERTQAGKDPKETGASVVGGREFFTRLQAMADRREAMILLLKRCLELALDANSMALGRSQTAREILFRLPKTWLHIDALARIVRIEERVQFRGEDLPESVFQESLELAKPMFGLGTTTQ